MKYYSTKKFIVCSCLCALAIVLQILENYIPIIPSVPGGKLGIANVVVLFVLYTYSAKYAFVISILKAVIATLLYGGINAMIYSLSGALFSVIAMILFEKYLSKYLSVIGISIIGAVFHNFGQVIVSVLIVNNILIIGYLSPLLIISIISGTLTGICVIFTLEKFKKDFKI